MEYGLKLDTQCWKPERIQDVDDTKYYILNASCNSEWAAFPPAIGATEVGLWSLVRKTVRELSMVGWPGYSVSRFVGMPQAMWFLFEEELEGEPRAEDCPELEGYPWAMDDIPDSYDEARWGMVELSLTPSHNALSCSLEWTAKHVDESFSINWYYQRDPDVKIDTPGRILSDALAWMKSGVLGDQAVIMQQQLQARFDTITKESNDG